MSVILALLSSLSWGTADFLGGLASRKRAVFAVVAGSQLCGLVAFGLLAIMWGAWSDPTGWIPWSIVSGLLGTSGLVCFYTALSRGTMGVVSPIAALGAVVPVVVGLIGGERLTAVTSVGLVVALAGAIAASGPELRAAREGDGSAMPVLLAAAAGVFFGAALVTVERGARYSLLMNLTGMRITSVLLFVVVALVVRTTGGLSIRDVPLLTAIGIGDAGANALFALAADQGLLSVAAVLGSLYPVVTVLLARWVLRERLTLIQQAGVVTALVGVVLVSWGRALG
ncbi:MAG: EamA family transporter [Actinomycetota bacterium]